MGQLDEDAFAARIRACAACGGASFEIRAYLDRRLAIMLGTPDDDGRWAYDGEKFVDGVHRIACTACGAVAFESADCPRCHAAGGLAIALGAPARIAPPKRCPTCKASELMIDGFAPAVVTFAGGRPPPPRAQAGPGEPGFHVATITCDACGPIAEVDGCPLCAAPGPLRARP